MLQLLVVGSSGQNVMTSDLRSGYWRVQRPQRERSYFLTGVSMPKSSLRTVLTSARKLELVRNKKQIFFINNV